MKEENLTFELTDDQIGILFGYSLEDKLYGLAPRGGWREGQKVAAISWYRKLREWASAADGKPRERLIAHKISEDGLAAGWLVYRAEIALMKYKAYLVALGRDVTIIAEGPGIRHLEFGDGRVPFSEQREQLQKAGDVTNDLIRRLDRLDSSGSGWLVCYGFNDFLEFERFRESLQFLAQSLAAGAAELVNISNRSIGRGREYVSRTNFVAALARAWMVGKQSAPGRSADGPFARYVKAAFKCVDVKISNPKGLISDALLLVRVSGH